MKNLKILLLAGSLTAISTRISAQNCAYFYAAVNNLTVTAYDSTSCSNASLIFYYWGDGAYGQGNMNGSNMHTYLTGGGYWITQVVYDTASSPPNWIPIDSFDLYVNVNSPIVNCASFTYSGSYNTITFTSTSTCSGATDYDWDFGDGNQGSGIQVTHTFASTGTYNVTLEVSDSAVFLDTVVQTVVVSSFPPLTCQALFSRAQALDSNNNPIAGHVVITDLSTANNPGYFWDFGDGFTSTSASPSHTYSGNGPYVLCLTITDSNCVDTYCDSLTVDSNGIIMKAKPGFTIHVGSYNPPVGPTGLEMVIAGSVNISPNPFSQGLNIDLIGNRNETVNLKLINYSGQSIYEKVVEIHTGPNRILLDPGSLDNGIYILQLRTSDGIATRKLVKN